VHRAVFYRLGAGSGKRCCGWGRGSGASRRSLRRGGRFALSFDAFRAVLWTCGVM